MKDLTAGKVANLAKVNFETLRYYERRGLLPAPQRTGSRYRLYTEESVLRLRFIKQAQELGFSLREIQDLLSLRARPRARCASVLARAKAKVREIDEKVRRLESMRKALLKLMSACTGKGPITACPILESLDAKGGYCDGGKTSKAKG